MPRKRPPLTLAQILAWADAHRGRTGQWPTQTSGPVVGEPAGLTWEAVNKALLLGRHGLPGGDSLARLLRRERGRPERRGQRADPARRREAAWLRSQGLTQEEIARRLGVSQQHVSRLLQAEPSRPQPGPAASPAELRTSIRARLVEAGGSAEALRRAVEEHGGSLGPATLSDLLAGLEGVAERLAALRALLPAAPPSPAAGASP